MRIHKITLIDPDVYEKHNAVRHFFPASNSGQTKVELAAKWLKQFRPGLEVVPLPYDLLAISRQQEIEEAVFSREEMHDLPVDLRTQFFKPDPADAKLTVLAKVDVKRLRYKKVDGRNKNDLTVVSVLFDRDGNYVTGATKILEMRLRDTTLNKLNGGITVKTSFDVKPGTYAVRLVVRDAEGQLMAAENGAVDIP